MVAIKDSYYTREAARLRQVKKVARGPEVKYAMTRLGDVLCSFKDCLEFLETMERIEELGGERFGYCHPYRIVLEQACRYHAEREQNNTLKQRFYRLFRTEYPSNVRVEGEKTTGEFNDRGTFCCMSRDNYLGGQKSHSDVSVGEEILERWKNRRKTARKPITKKWRIGKAGNHEYRRQSQKVS